MGEKGQNTINRIKSEAMELFLQRGYKDVSMQDICNACGLSKGGLYSGGRMWTDRDSGRKRTQNR